MNSAADRAVVRRASWCSVVAGTVCAIAALASGWRSADAQLGRQVQPNDRYVFAFRSFYAGEYRDALEGFREAARGGVVTPERRWIDSICYFTMLGECYYHLGQLGVAWQQYDAALKLYLKYKDWMLSVQFPEAIEPSASSVRSRITWGTSSRRAKLGRYPDRMGILVGRADNDQVLRQGGVVAPPELRLIRVQEIVRCTALALRRRRELLGPACPYDPLTTALVSAASRRAAPPNHWSQAWADVQLGMAYAAAGKVPEATTALHRSLMVAGQYDHPMTGGALLELGKLALEHGKYDAAARYFHEATLAAAQFDHYDEMEEAFRFGTLLHLVTQKKGLYPPLTEAAAWARTRRALALQASLYLLASECSTAQGQAGPAAAFLSQAQRTIGRRGMAYGTMGARLQFQAARVAFQQGNSAAGTSALAQAMAYQRTSSRWLFQAGLVDRLYVNGDVGSRIAGQLFQNVLREPTAQDWTFQPRETLGVLLAPPLDAMQHWFELALVQRRENEKALEIADRIRRRRFYRTLPMGGRLMALRWILQAPKQALNDRAILQRQDLLTHYPAYAELAEKARAVQQQLHKIALAPEDEKTKKKQAALLVQWSKLSAAQEGMLRDMALRRHGSELVFPPQRTVQEIQERMPPRQLTLAFFSTGQNVYAMLLSKQKLAVRRVADPPQLKKQVAALLRAMGHFDRDQRLAAERLRSSQWKEPARKMLELLVGEAKAALWEKFDELVIVPDGVLWYLPFEALQVPDGDATVALLSKVPIRLAPTISTTVPDDRGRPPVARTAVFAGKMFPRDGPEVADRAVEQLRAAVPDAARLAGKLPAPSRMFAALCDRLIVLDDVDAATGGPYNWAPMQIDRGRPGSTLADWLTLPWDGPSQLVLPGFHTPAEDGLRRGGTGDELLLTVCGLMATGARTILLSRWRTAGQTSYDLTREFVRELPRSPASKAWRRSVQLARASEIDPALEPRVSATSLDHSLTADHPFFWAGYLLVDTGAAPKIDAAAPPEPPAETKKKPSP